MVRLAVGDECGLLKMARLEREVVQKWHTQSRAHGVRRLAWTGNRDTPLGREAMLSAALRSGVIRTWDMTTMQHRHDMSDAPSNVLALEAVGKLRCETRH